MKLLRKYLGLSVLLNGALLLVYSGMVYLGGFRPEFSILVSQLIFLPLSFFSIRNFIFGSSRRASIGFVLYGLGFLLAMGFQYTNVLIFATTLGLDPVLVATWGVVASGLGFFMFQKYVIFTQ